MRILLLTQWFQPEPFFKGLPLACALRDRGHEVEVLTGFPNYPGGKVYPGFKVRPWRRDVIDGIRVNRVALYPSHSRSGTGRIANYLTFGASAALLGPWLVRKPDVVYVYNLITLGFAARMLRGLKGSRIVLDVEDLWPESVTASGMMRNRILLGMLQWWCRAEYRGPDRLIVLSPGFKQNLVDRRVPEEKIEVVYNWCDESALDVPPADEDLSKRLGFAGRFNVVFAGTMGAAQGLSVVIEAARQLIHREPDVLFTLVGDGIEVERLKTAAEGLPNVQFLPRQSLAEVGRIFAISQALLVHLMDDPLFSITIPSKVQAYLHAGKPILCGLRGDGADIVRRANAGVAFTPDDPDALAAAVGALRRLGAEGLQQMGENGQAYYQRHMSLHEGVWRIEQVLEQAVARPSLEPPSERKVRRDRGSSPRGRFAKRAMDVVGAGLGLLAAAPLFVLIAAAVRLAMGRPVLFRQRRPGFHGKPFEMLKFRTMLDRCDAEGELLPDAQRLSRLGRFLRRTSLDELPELWNVMRGDMSLVGPRPLLMEYLDRYTPEQGRRHEVKPGITGWAQIHGRNSLSWEQKFALDVWYVDHWSLRLDLLILLKTAWKVLRSEGISAQAHATMPKFTGTRFHASEAQCD